MSALQYSISISKMLSEILVQYTRFRYLSHNHALKALAGLSICADSPELSLLAKNKNGCTYVKSQTRYKTSSPAGIRQLGVY